MVYTITTKQSDLGGNIYIYESDGISVPLNSLYSPEKEAQRFLRKLSDIEKKFVIFIGFGNGVLLESLIESEVYKQNIHFLFIEPFAEIRPSDQQVSIFNENEKISFYSFEHFNSLGFAKFIAKFNGIPVSIYIHPNYIKADEPVVKKCLNIIHEGTVTKQILNNTEMRFAIDWIVEPLLNTQYIPKSTNIKSMQGKFTGEKAILVASGPSLKEHIGFIKDKQNSHYLFSVGSSLRALMKNDIDPDFVLSVDASDRNYETHFEGLNYKGTLIYETMSNSNIQKHHLGSLIVSKAGSDHVTSQVFSDLYSFPRPSPSVAIYTLQVIAYLGFSEVYLVGQDLALVDGEYYASGIKHHAGMSDLENELWVESNGGEKVGTTRALKIFLDSFESLIQTLPEELEIFNLSERGAKIKGATYLAASEVNHDHGKKLFSCSEDVVRSSLDSPPVIKEFIDRLALLRGDVHRANKKIERLLKVRAVSSEDMFKVVKSFRVVSKNEILEEIILSKLTFMFDKIINKFEYLEEKQKYMNEDLLSLIKDLAEFYELVMKYIDEILEDNRLKSFK